MSSALKLSDSLAAGMWTVALMIIFINVLLIVMGWPRKKETTVNGFYLYYLLLCNLLTAIFVLLLASMNNGIKEDDGGDKKYRALCSFSGYLGIASWLLSLSGMLTMASNILLWLLFPRRFKRGKNYLPKMRAIAFIEALIIIVVLIVPFLPVDVFEIAQGSSRHRLCLPLYHLFTPMWEVTLVLYVLESLGIFIIFLLCAVMFCHLGRQQNILESAIPMEARVVRKNSLLVKRLSCLYLGMGFFWIPPLLTLLCMFAGINVSDTVLQWMFGVVQPFGSAAGPFLYLLRVSCKNYTFSSCLKGAKNKVEKTKNAVQLQVGQMTGTITVPKKMDVYRMANGKDATASVESVSSPSQRSGKCLNAPPVVHWVETVPIIGRHMNMNFGIVEWQSKNGSPRRGLLKIFTKPHTREWRNESAILYRLSKLEHHRNIVEYLWHSKSSQTKLDRVQRSPDTHDEKSTLQRFVCTAYYQHGTLRDFLHSHPRTIQDSHVHAIATQVSAGVAYLHAMSIVHGLVETTSVLIGGHVETMAIKVVIANFSRATDLTRKPSSSHESKDQHSPRDNSISNAAGIAITNVPGSTVYQETKPERELPVKVMLAGDVRSFALLLLEMIAWLKMIRVPEDGQMAGSSKSWTLDRSLKRLTRGWTLAPSNREAWTDDEDAHVRNRNLSSSMDSCGSSTDDILSDNGPAIHCWENAVADIREKCRCHSVEEFNSSSSPADHPSWEEIGTYPRRTKRHKHYPTEEFSSEKTIQSQQRTGNKYSKSDSSSGSSQKELSSGSATKEEAKRSLAKMTEDGSCCIVNPYFDMMASDDELSPKDSLPCTPKQSVTIHAPPERIVTGSEKIRPEPTPKNGRKNLNHCYSMDESNCSKRGSLCSLDSGISSHQSSMRSSGSDPPNSRKEDIMLPGFKPKSHLMMKRQRMHQPDMHGTFEAFPENEDDGVFVASTGETRPGTGQHVETWVENHTVPNGHYKQNIMVERTQMVKPRLPQTLEESELPSPDKQTLGAVNKPQNGDLKEQVDKDNKRTESPNGDVVNGEKGNSKSKVTVARSASSLSQFYVRKRAPRPHNITIVPGSTATLPVSMQRRSIHAPDSPRLLDMGRGRPSSCHGQVACNKSNSLDSKDSASRICCAHSQCPSENQASCPSANGTLHRQSRSLEDQCVCQSPIAVSRTGQVTQTNTDPSHCIPASIRKLHRQDAILESISESSRINHSSRSFEDQMQPKRQSVRKKVAGSKRTPTSGITQQHVNFCQELQALLPCLPKVVLGFWWKQQGCGQAVLQWIDSIKDYDGCLYNQLISILESCWSKEPALSSSEVHLMLDNCLTEVAL
ncbi:uncharacterized protein [Asterias amurensis]|uniref:uncharacterized protein isoform X2 n=1 Tax=Asterias amurensis TaxID=7602 RepID=UPI003AB45DA6